MKTRRGITSVLLGLLLPVALATAGASVASAAEGGAAPSSPIDTSAAASPPGWLHTSGGRIVTSTGSPYTIRGIAWFGMETSYCAPHGLDTITLASGMQHIKQMGFTTVRLPYSNQCLASSSVSGVSADRSLAGLTPLQVMDHVVAAAKAAGLNVFLDQHRPDSGAQSELWYTSQYPESTWISDWRMLAKRYAADPTVIGVDLHNEPHGSATWGTGSASTDWRAAAERGGNAVLAENPNLLVIVEGLDHESDGSGTWWGGALGWAGSAPVRLSVADRVVYSPHEYGSSLYGQPWFSSPDFPSNMPGVWDAHWGYLAKKDVAPVLVGEFGTKLETTSDKQWLSTLVGYLASTGISSSFWAFNPDSGDTGGIVKSDWVTPEQAKLDAMAPILHPSSGSASGAGSSPRLGVTGR
jgi:aryl-phospho-beta-D-glucosidase BglC (GH1 family)